MASQATEPMGLTVHTKARVSTVPALVTAGLAALVVFYYATLLFPRDFWERWVIKEDRIVELPGSLALLAAAVIFGLAFRHLRRTGGPQLLTWACLALAGVFFFGFGEEISWGQRILGLGNHVGTGDLNKQDELNLHNLKLFSGWFTVDRMFQVFWVGFGVLIPVAARLSVGANAFLRPKVPVLPVAIAALLAANQIVADVWRELMDDRYASIYPLHYSVFEIKESVISILLAVGAYYWYRGVRDDAAISGS